LREGFGNAYRLAEKDWAKLYAGRFYNPAYHAAEIDPKKVIMFHAKDDPYVPYASVSAFARTTGVKLKSLRTGGHIRTEWVVRKFWPEIRAVLESR
jgi:predicted alpha/beta hydrolase family esterase